MNKIQAVCNFLSVVLLIYASAAFGWKGAVVELLASALMAMFMVSDEKWHD